MRRHTVQSYDNTLRELENIVNNMGRLVFESIENITHLLEEPGKDWAKKAIEHDRKINNHDFEMERKVTEILALRQPMAIDLRHIIASVKVSSNVERMGDVTKNTIKKLSKIDYKIPKKTKNTLVRMLERASMMAKQSIEAFNELNIELASKVLAEDDAVDEMYFELLSGLQQDMLENPNNIPAITNIIFIAKSFERFGDYATNIAELTHYVVTGKPFKDDH